MAFGAGVLVSAVAFELVGEAATKSIGEGAIALGLLAGRVVLFVGDLYIDRMGGADRNASGGAQADGSPLAITLASSSTGSRSRSCSG
jgi:zinc transporter, ZIP family